MIVTAVLLGVLSLGGSRSTRGRCRPLKTQYCKPLRETEEEQWFLDRPVAGEWIENLWITMCVIGRALKKRSKREKPRNGINCAVL
jgi:hypothetical protein